MRLLHVTTVSETLGFLRGQIGYMRDRGVEVHVASSPSEHLRQFSSREGVAGHAVPMQRRISPLSDVVSIVRLHRLFGRIEPTIVHAHTPKAGLLSMIAGRLAGVRVLVYHVHGLPFLSASGARRRLLMGAERCACRLAHVVIAVSRSMRDTLVEQGLCEPTKLALIGCGSINGVDAAERFHPAKVPVERTSMLRDSLGIPSGSPVLGFAGRIVRDKGVEDLARGWQALRGQFPRLHLVLAGLQESGDPVAPSSMDDLESDDRVRLPGWIEDMPAFYQCIDVLVLPSHREGFGCAAAEASAMGKPVVATRIPGCVDSVVDGVTGTLVDVRDPAGLAAAVARYLDRPALREAHGAAGRLRVLRDFIPEVVWEGTLQLYRGALSGTAAPVAPAIARKPIQSALKRILDLVGATIVLLLTSPLILGAALAIGWSMGRPTLYRQDRPGRDERPFTMLKFRTMTDRTDRDGNLLGDGQRLTRLGRFLRRFSIDELPTLWNVLRGEMSLVGPRPLLTRYLPWYTDRERVRCLMRPGLTGWAQVNGRNRVSWTERLALDVWYVNHWSLGLDARILLETVGAVLLGKNVVEDPHSEMRNLDEERASCPGQLTAAPEDHGPVIRRAAIRDSGAIVQIIRKGFDPMLLSTTIYSCEGVANYVADRVAADGPACFTLLETDGRVAACVETRIDQDGLFVGYIAVAPERQGAGLGSRMLASSIRLARLPSSETVRLDVFESNTRAMRWYTRLGFELEAKTPIWSSSLPVIDGDPGELELCDWDESEVQHRRYGFSSFRLRRGATAWTVGRLGRSWFRIQDPALLRDRAALARLRSIDPQRKLLTMTPGDTLSGGLFEDSMRLGVSCRMRVDVETVLRRLG